MRRQYAHPSCSTFAVRLQCENLTSAPDLETVNVEKVLTTVPVRRPGKNDFFRVRPGEDFVIDNYVLEHVTDKDQTTYWVTADLWDALRDNLRKVRLFTCIDKRGYADVRQTSPIALKAAPQLGAVGRILRTEALVIAGTSLPDFGRVGSERRIGA